MLPSFLRDLLVFAFIIFPLTLQSRPSIIQNPAGEDSDVTQLPIPRFKPGVLEVRKSAEEPDLKYHLYVPRSLKEGQTADVMIYYPGVSGVADSISLYRPFAEASGVILLGINYDNLRNIAHIQWYPGPALKDIRSRYQISSRYFLLGFSDGGTYVMEDLASRSDQIKAVVVHESSLWDSVAAWDMFDRRFRDADRTIPILLTCGMPEACASHSDSLPAYRGAGFASIQLQEVDGGHYLNAAQAKAAADFFERYQ
ncbi:MAG: hypothetical protein KDK25_04180 [Leptospiraceae bacterium]|nr:hypothetical protein [Leptospiraceae bacterium]